MSDWYIKILDQFHKERNTKIFYDTRGFKELWRNIQDITRKESFKSQMQVLRKEFSIPVNGYRVEDKTWTHPPKEWRHYPNRFAKRIQIKQELDKICEEYQLLPRDWADMFENYLFYKKILFSWEPNSHNLCFVSDATTNLDSLGRSVNSVEKKIFPVTLHISPYASERNIIDYIKKVYTTEIKPLQQRYVRQGVLIGKTRKRNNITSQINDFIYENQDWSTKDLISYIHKKYRRTFDHGHIKKIISLENKKRN